MQTVGVENFTAIDSWLIRWKEQNNIVYCKLHGEKLVADFDARSYWKIDVLPNLLKDYDLS